jgi:hypothetical protein
MLEKDPAQRFATVEEAVKAIGGTPMDLDDPRREEMKLLAQKGTAAELRRRVRTPASPVPTNVPTTRISAKAPPPTAVAPRRRPWVWPVAGLVVLAVGAVLVVTRPWVSRVSTLEGPVAVRDTAPAAVIPAPPAKDSTPRSVATTVPSGPVKPEPLAGRSAAPSPLATAAPNGDSAFRAMRRDAQTARDRAAQAGASAADLAPGDQAARNADALAADGRLPGAMTRLMRAAGLWAQAERAVKDRAAEAEAARTAAANPAPSSPAPAAPDEATVAIQGVVAAYARALESRDLGQVRRVYPGLTLRQEEGMRRLFRRAQDLRVTLQLGDLRRSGDTAEGRVTGQYTFTGPATHVLEHSPVFHRVAFRRDGSTWVLTAIE